MDKVIIKDELTQSVLGCVSIARVPVANGRETIFFKGKDLLVKSVRMLPHKTKLSKDLENIRAVVYVDNQE